MILSFLIVLIKRYGLLGSRTILRADWVKKSWALYEKIEAKLSEKELMRVLKGKPFGLHYAVAVKRLVSGNLVNCTFLFEQMKGELPLLLQGNDLQGKDGGEEQYIRFLEYCFCAENYVLTYTYNNFLKDKKSRNMDLKLQNYYYFVFHYFMKLCNLEKGKEILYALKLVKNKITEENDFENGKDSIRERAFGNLMSLVVTQGENISPIVIFYSVTEIMRENQMCHVTLGRLSPVRKNCGHEDGGERKLIETGLDMCENGESCMRIKMRVDDYKKERNIMIDSHHLIFNISRLLPKKNHVISHGMLLITDISQVKETIQAGRVAFAYQLCFNIFSGLPDIEKYVNDAFENDVKGIHNKEVALKRKNIRNSDAESEGKEE